MNKKKKGILERFFEFQAKPLKILAKETAEGIKEGLNDKEKKKD